jgi:hypothetical protein
MDQSRREYPGTHGSITLEANPSVGNGGDVGENGNGGDVGENTTYSLAVPTGFPSNRTQDKLTRVTDVKAG